jgi:hypothetical protein
VKSCAPGESEIKIGTKGWWPSLLCVGKFGAGAKCGGGGHVCDAVVRIPLWVQMVGSALVFCSTLHLLPRLPLVGLRSLYQSAGCLRVIR